MRKVRVKVDIEELCNAFDDADVGRQYFLDLGSSEIIFISDYIEEDEGLIERVEEGIGKRYIPIPKMSPAEGYRDMEDFIETVGNENLKEKLYIAIDGPGAFRRFKNVLLRYLEEKERWFKFKDARTTERVKEWLEAEGIETVVSLPRPGS